MANKISRTLIVGDIHGCFDELMQLVRGAGLGPDDDLVAVGDLIDRGPNSLDVVRYFASDPVHRRSVLGNHEEKHLLGVRTDREDPSGRVLRRQVSDAEYAEMRSFFATLPLWIDLPEALVIHAGLVAGRSLDQQNAKVLTGRGSQGRSGFDGKSTPWYDDEAFSWPKPVVFGHLASPAIVRGERQNVWGIDTGASVGGRLSGVLLPGFEILSVPTPDYFSDALSRYRDEFLMEDLPDTAWPEIQNMDFKAISSSVAIAFADTIKRLSTAVALLASDIDLLRAESRWLELTPEQKAAVGRSLRSDGRLRNRWGALVLGGLSGRKPDDIIRRELPTPKRLSEALETRRG